VLEERGRGAVRPLDSFRGKVWESATLRRPTVWERQFMTELTFAAGHVFFRAGEPGEQAFLLHEVQVEILAGSSEPFTRVGLCMPGDVFGEMALIEERPRSLTARAVTAGRATAMTRAEFEHLLTHDPARTRQYLRSLFERLRALTARLGTQVETGSRLVPLSNPPSAFLPALTVGQIDAPGPAESIGSPSASGLPELQPGQGKPSSWVVVVHPLTRKAAETLPEEGLRVTRFPLRIGRAAGANERDAFDLNDLWLLDEKPYNVSRNHCEIQVDGIGPSVCDRGSHLGCIVNDESIGGRSVMDFARLDPGENVLVIGSRMSPYQFRVTVTSA
jgi:CRP-like cAMP-binding protein